MLFTKYLRDGVRSGAITTSVRVWHHPRVTAGKRYRMEEGEIEIDSIVPISFRDITPKLARACGFERTGDLLKVAKHGSGENVYLVRFHYIPPGRSLPAFAIKAEVRDVRAATFAFDAQKTMYGGKQIAEGDSIFIFASENEGGPGLIAMGVVTAAEPVAKKRGVARQTPRVSITVQRTAIAKRRLGRTELKRFSDWKDGRPETELNFKFYRQATNKIVGVSDAAAAFLSSFF